MATITKNTPTVFQLERFARFLGYNQYNPVFRYESANWEIVDIYRNGKKHVYVERYRDRLGKLVSGYHPVTGQPN